MLRHVGFFQQTQLHGALCSGNHAWTAPRKAGYVTAMMPDLLPLVTEHAPLLAALLLAGAAAGLLAGLFGVGGGTVLVPALFQVFTSYGYGADTAMHLAVATSLATIIPTGISSARAHHWRGAVDKGVLRTLAPSVAVGALVGAAISGYFKGLVLTLMFAVFASIIAALMLRGKKGFALVKQMPTGAGRHGLGAFIGSISALLGIGGGTISVPTLAACGYAMPVAVGTGAALGLAIAVPGTLGFIISGWGAPDLPPFSVGYINLIAVVVIAPMSVLLAPQGARLAHWLPEVWLRRGFAGFLLLVAGRMLYKALA
jgi:uncharacterized protein